MWGFKAGITSFVAVAILAGVGDATAQGPATSQPSAGVEQSDDSSAQSVSAIKRLLEAGIPPLTMDQKSGADRFSFVTELIVPLPRASPHRVVYRVVREQDRVAILVTNKDGLPYCYLTSGLLVMFDPTVRGQLMVYEGGNPSFTFESDNTRSKVNFLVTYAKALERATVQFDVASLLEGSLNRLRSAHMGAKRGLLAVRTEHGMLSVLLAPDEKPSRFPIQGMMFMGGNGPSILVSDISIDAKPPLDLFGITRKTVEELNVPLRVLGNKEILNFDLIVPPGFPASPKEREVAERWRALFPLNGDHPNPTSRAATQPAPNPKPRKFLPFPRSQRVRIMDEEGGRNGPIQTASPALDSAPSGNGVYRAG